MREVAPEHGADLRDLPSGAEPVEPGGERLLQRRRYRRRAALDAALQEEARDLFDKQGHAPAALAHPFNDLLGQRISRGELADHARDLRAIERRQRDHAMMRLHAPGRAKLRPCGRNDQERRLRATLRQHAHEIERGRIGPVQILEGEHDRLRPRARQNPGRYRRQLPASQFFRREFRPAILGRGPSTSSAVRGGAYSSTSRPTEPESILEISKSLFVGRVGAAEPQAAPFHDRMQRRVL